MSMKLGRGDKIAVNWDAPLGTDTPSSIHPVRYDQVKAGDVLWLYRGNRKKEKQLVVESAGPYPDQTYRLIRVLFENGDEWYGWPDRMLERVVDPR